MVRLAANLSFLFPDVPFLERVDRAASAGFGGLESMYPDDVDGTELAARVAATGLEWVLLNTPAGDFAAGERGLAALPGQEGRFRAALQDALALADRLQAGQIHVMAGIPAAGADPAACRDTFCANLDWAAGQAAAAGRGLTIEPINRRDIPGYFLWQVDQALAILRDVAQPNVKLQFDIYHAQIVGGDVATRLLAALPQTGHVQIANPPGRHGPGDGELDLPFLLRLLDEAGYDGWVGCEYKPTGRTEEGLAWARGFGLRPPG
ncbi:MAG: TIM barrel protein [Sneathiellaceae bacterium]